MYYNIQLKKVWFKQLILLLFNPITRWKSHKIKHIIYEHRKLKLKENLKQKTIKNKNTNKNTYLNIIKQNLIYTVMVIILNNYQYETY